VKRILVFLLIFLIPTTIVEGYCQYNEVAKYKSLASNITTSYEYVENNGKVTFSITLNNLNEELYFVDSVTGKRYNYKTEEIIIDKYEPGQTVKYQIYAVNKFCSDELLYTIRVNLPGYNPYYNDPICEGIDDYIYCKKWQKNDLEYKEFIKKVTNYKNLLNQKEPVMENPKEMNSILKAIIDVFVDYYHVILISIITICGIIIYVINKKSDIYR